MFNRNEFLLLLPSIFQFLNKKSLSAFSLASQFSRRFAFGNRIKFQNLDDNTLDFSIREINYWKNEPARKNQLLRFDFGSIKSNFIKKSGQKIRALFQLLADNNIPYSFESSDLDFTELVKVLDGIEFKKSLEGIRLSVNTFIGEKDLANLFSLLPTSLKTLLISSFFSPIYKRDDDDYHMYNRYVSLPKNIFSLLPELKKLELIASNDTKFILCSPIFTLSRPRLSVNLRELNIPAGFLLETFDLSASHITKLEITHWSGENIEPLAQLSNLRKLKISRDKGTLYLDLSKLFQLEEFEFYINIVEEIKIPSFKLPSNLKKLEIISRAKASIYLPKESINLINLAQQCPYLKELIYDDNSINPVISFSALPSTLRKLKISAFVLHHDCPQELLHLEELEISGDWSREKFKSLILSNTLEKLTISGFVFSIKELDRLQEIPHLKGLKISFRHLENEYESIISNLAKLPVNLDHFIINDKDCTEQYLQEKNKLSPLDKPKVASVFAGKPKENSQRTCAEISCTILIL